MQAGLLFLAIPAAAQVELGGFQLRSNGTIASGYSADFGNEISSDHGWTVGGVANLSGSFYSPSFLSFDIGVYLNQSNTNSDFQSISNSSGVNASANIFGGSHFPGSINYSKAINSQGNYAVPGIANYVTHGDNDSLGVTWSENFLNVPTFSASFQRGAGQYSVYGTNDEGKNNFDTLNLHSNYGIAGFKLAGFYTWGDGHSLIPDLTSGEQGTEIKSDSDGLGFIVSHSLPLRGSISASANRSSWDSYVQGETSSGSVDFLDTTAAVNPTDTLSLSASATYSDNLSGQLIEAIVAAGGTAPELDSSQTSDSLDMEAQANYSPIPNLRTSATVDRRTQHYLGEDYGVTSYGAGAGYSRRLFDGNLNASMNFNDSTEDKSGENFLGFSTSENYSNVVLGWRVNGSFGYAQNVQTLLVTYMNSSYNYSGGVARKWGKFHVGAAASAARTALTDQPGTANSSESYSATVGYRPWITASGSYNKSNGQALLTGAGLVTVPVPSPVLPTNLLSLYGGDGYSMALSSTPLAGLTMSASYSKSTSNTSASGATSMNEGSQFNSLVQYRVRKLEFTSGFSRLEQGFSASGTGPEVISSFYVGLSRWFNFF